LRSLKSFSSFPGPDEMERQLRLKKPMKYCSLEYRFDVEDEMRSTKAAGRLQE
jgi:hypothetical protein